MESISDNEMGTETKTTDKNRRILNVPGLRITHQRASILEIIRQGKGHLDADEVYRRARERQPRLSLSTVYRTMQTLKKLGLIDGSEVRMTGYCPTCRQERK
ncbi:MAG: transcriptional repressor [Chloroflexi bacterium]|nr:transcriptional repressor [Chloroflexota bacterium]